MPTVARHPPRQPGLTAGRDLSLSERLAANRLGVSVYRLLAVQDLTATVHALDAIDGTPILDLTPYVAEFAPPRAAAPARAVPRTHGRLLDPAEPPAAAHIHTVSPGLVDVCGEVEDCLGEGVGCFEGDVVAHSAL